MSASPVPATTLSSTGGPTGARERGRPWTAAAAVGYVVLSLVGLALAPLPDLGSGAAAVRHFLAGARPAGYVVGGCADLLAYLSLLAFALGISGPARTTAPHRGATLLAAAGGTAALGSITTAAALVGAVVLTPGVPAPTAEVVLTAGSLATWLSVVGLALVPAACAALGRAGTGLPRWSVRGAAVIAVLLGAAVPLAETPAGHLPALLLDLWLLAVAVVLLRRGPRAAG